MTSTNSVRPRWALPTRPPGHDPILFARAMRDMRLTWRARGVLAELATGYPDDDQPLMHQLSSLTREERLAAEGREAFRKAVAELRTLGYLKPESDGVAERLAVNLDAAKDARLVHDRFHRDADYDGR
ncbi:hypothetical protein ACF08B_39070 [Streptomyces sp. NPDC015139]|uniref:hypothetical protein n=1 Tax=Streptomyces sp. NPDC015139 TaxID=3364942 RepID=UPI0037029E0B